MGTIVAFHASYELQHQHPGLVHGVVYSGCALVPGPSAASPFGVRCLFCLTQVRADLGAPTRRANSRALSRSTNKGKRRLRCRAAEVTN